MMTVVASASAALPLLVQRLEEADTREIGPGLIAFTIVVLLGVATFFLLRSMIHHIGKVPPTFEDDVPDGPSGRDVG